MAVLSRHAEAGIGEVAESGGPASVAALSSMLSTWMGFAARTIFSDSHRYNVPQAWPLWHREAACLAREQHFGRSAELCNVCQLSLSDGIKQLEDMFRRAVMRRSRRSDGACHDGDAHHAPAARKPPDVHLAAYFAAAVI